MMHKCIDIRLLSATFLRLIISTGVAFGATGITGDNTITSCEMTR